VVASGDAVPHPQAARRGLDPGRLHGRRRAERDLSKPRAIEIRFDPSQTTYRRLFEFFFQIHDPTTLNRQGNNCGMGQCMSTTRKLRLGRLPKKESVKLDMSIAFVTNLQAPKRVQPSNRTFDWPTGFTKPAAMVRTDFCEHRLDATGSQALTVSCRTVDPVTLNDYPTVQRAYALYPYMRNGLDQWGELGNVVAIRAGQDDRERDALRVDDEMMLASKLAPVRGIRACFFPASMARIDESTRQIDFTTSA